MLGVCDGYYYAVETGFYYVSSRYYDPEVGRFLNADGYVSTGTGILGFNMFAYCNNNPVNFADPTGTCITNARGETFHNNCGYMYIDSRAENGVLASIAKTKEIVGVGVTWFINVVKYSYDTAPKPNYVATGIFRKDKKTKIAQIDNVSNVFYEVMDIADFIIINGEIVYGVYGNCKNQASDLKIVWDIMVDGAVLGTNSYVVSQVSTAILASTTGLGGITVAVVAGLGVGYSLDALGNEVRKELKGWVK